MSVKPQFHLLNTDTNMDDWSVSKATASMIVRYICDVHILQA